VFDHDFFMSSVLVFCVLLCVAPVLRRGFHRIQGLKPYLRPARGYTLPTIGQNYGYSQCINSLTAKRHEIEGSLF